MLLVYSSSLPVTQLKAVSITHWWRSFWWPSVAHGCYCYTICWVMAWLLSPCCAPASTLATIFASLLSQMSLAAHCGLACLPLTHTSQKRCNVSSLLLESSPCSGIFLYSVVCLWCQHTYSWYLFLDVIKCFSLIVPFSVYYKNYTFLLILFPALSTWSCLLHSFLWWSTPACVPSSAMAMPTSWKPTSCCPLWVFCPLLVANGMISLCICYSWRRTSANSSPTNTSRCVGIELPLVAALLVLVQIL